MKESFLTVTCGKLYGSMAHLQLLFDPGYFDGDLFDVGDEDRFYGIISLERPWDGSHPTQVELVEPP